MNLAPFISSLLLLCLVSFGVHGQTLVDDTKVLDVLVFEHVQKDKKKMVSQGASIRYKLRATPKVWIKGTLEKIKKGSMVVDGKEVAFDACLIIAGRVRTNDAVIGGVAIGIGLSNLIFGSALLGNIWTGATLLVGGTGLLVTGLVLVTKSKRFNLDKGWEVHHGQLKYSTTH
ncbi:MAG: hypothetical protein ACRBFS_12930 [Aureispira sp.]